MSIPFSYDSADTIAAVATACGEAGISIVRLSGSRALAIADGLFRAKDARRLSQCATHTLHYGWIVDPKRSSAPLDEVLVSVMRAPRSYTREDVVEINCHGGVVAARGVLEAALDKGARLAAPGEFTRRAFVNGRIDLSQAEAVLDIIRSKTDAALALGMQQLSGNLSRRLRRLCARVTAQRARIEAQIDFPDEELEADSLVQLRAGIALVRKDLRGLVSGAGRGRLMREGISVVICGKPNVGKSSLLNALLRQERSIVTPIAGTTRDSIEEIVDIRGLPVRIADTAGIVEPTDLLERKAVARSRALIRSADLVVAVFDASRRFDRQDRLILSAIRAKRVVTVVNKIDRAQRLDESRIRSARDRLVRLSARRLTNLGAFEEAIVEAFHAAGGLQRDAVLITHARHARLLMQAEKSVASSLESLDNKLSIECAAQGLAEAQAAVEEILGSRAGADVLEAVFRDFCIGK
jgi:tRNA modification GTPase